MSLMKVILLHWYSDEKIIFRMIKWNLASKNDSKLWKFPIFDSSDSKSLTRYQKILWICSLKCENLLNFTWHSMKFHNCHHANQHVKTTARVVTLGILNLLFFFFWHFGVGWFDRAANFATSILPYKLSCRF